MADAPALDFLYETMAPIGSSPPQNIAPLTAPSHPIDLNLLAHELYPELSLPEHGEPHLHALQDAAASVVFRRIIDDDENQTAGNGWHAAAAAEEEEEFLSLNIEGVEDEAGVMLQTAEKIESASAEGAQILLRSGEAPPWVRRAGDGASWLQSPFLQLHQEIVDFCEFVSPTQEEQQVRIVAFQRVTNVIKSIWPHCQVKVFGSFATGLYLPTSDIDVVILDSGCQETQSGLRALAKALAKESIAKSLQVIAKARVPIVKFVERESDISFDVSFDLQNGPQAAEFIKDAVKALPPLKPLCLVLKIFLQQRDLNEVYTGGIGSYALLVMILTHLQMHPSKLSYSSSGEANTLEQNLGILLVDFLDLYGRTLNVKDVGISCRDGGRFFSKKSKRFLDSKKPYLLSVEDPQTPDNDIGRSSFNFQKIRTAFMLAHRFLTAVDAKEALMQAGLLCRIVRMDEKLTGRKKIPASMKDDSRLMAFEQFSPLEYLKNSTGQQLSSRIQVDGHSQLQVYEEQDFPRGGSKDGQPFKRGTKRKRFKDKKKEQHASLEKKGKHKHKQARHHRMLANRKSAERNINSSKNNRSVDLGLDRSSAWMREVDDDKLAYNHINPHERGQVSFKKRKNHQQWYSEYEHNYQQHEWKLARRNKLGKGHIESVPEGICEGREQSSNSSVRRVIAKAAHRKIRYF